MSLLPSAPFPFSILCPSCREIFKSFQKFKKLTNTLCHEHTHAIKKKLLSRVGESLVAYRGKTEVLLVLH
jgi:predicted nucleic acid-binding Zn ribbon protein